MKFRSNFKNGDRVVVFTNGNIEIGTVFDNGANYSLPVYRINLDNVAKHGNGSIPFEIHRILLLEDIQKANVDIKGLLSYFAFVVYLMEKLRRNYHYNDDVRCGKTFLSAVKFIYETYDMHNICNIFLSQNECNFKSELEKSIIKHIYIFNEHTTELLNAYLPISDRSAIIDSYNVGYNKMVKDYANLLT